jgi:prophage regulatory protein
MKRKRNGFSPLTAKSTRESRVRRSAVQLSRAAGCTGLDITESPTEVWPLLPPEGFVRIDTVLSIFPVGKSTWWKGIKEGIYPKPVMLGVRAAGWRVHDIRSLLRRVSTAPAGNQS